MLLSRKADLLRQAPTGICGRCICLAHLWRMLGADRWPHLSLTTYHRIYRLRLITPYRITLQMWSRPKWRKSISHTPCCRAKSPLPRCAPISAPSCAAIGAREGLCMALPVAAAAMRLMMQHHLAAPVASCPTRRPCSSALPHMRTRSPARTRTWRRVRR